MSITNLSSANQALSIIGSYIAVSGPPNTNGLAGNDVPSYRIYDSSVLSQYPIAVGHPTQFPSRGFFTDENTDRYSCTGSFMARPTFSVNSIADAQAWFDSASAKTSLPILKSFYLSCSENEGKPMYSAPPRVFRTLVTTVPARWRILSQPWCDTHSSGLPQP